MIFPTKQILLSSLLFDLTEGHRGGQRTSLRRGRHVQEMQETPSNEQRHLLYTSPDSRDTLLFQPPTTIPTDLFNHPGNYFLYIGSSETLPRINVDSVVLKEATTPTVLTTWGAFYEEGYHQHKRCGNILFSVVIYADDNGVPSAEPVFETTAPLEPNCCVNEVVGPDTGNISTEYQCDIDLRDEVDKPITELPAGTYWFSLASNTDGCSDASSHFWAWEVGTEDPMRGMDGSLVTTRDGSGHWQSPYEYTLNVTDGYIDAELLKTVDFAWALSNSTEPVTSYNDKDGTSKTTSTQTSKTNSSKNKSSKGKNKVPTCGVEHELPATLRGGVIPSYKRSKKGGSGSGKGKGGGRRRNRDLLNVDVSIEEMEA